MLNTRSRRLPDSAVPSKVSRRRKGSKNTSSSCVCAKRANTLAWTFWRFSVQAKPTSELSRHANETEAAPPKTDPVPFCRAWCPLTLSLGARELSPGSAAPYSWKGLSPPRTKRMFANSETVVAEAGLSETMRRGGPCAVRTLPWLPASVAKSALPGQLPGSRVGGT